MRAQDFRKLAEMTSADWDNIVGKAEGNPNEMASAVLLESVASYSVAKNKVEPVMAETEMQ